MQRDYLIELDEFCANHNIGLSFISALQQTGLIKIKTIKEEAPIGKFLSTTNIVSII